MTDYANTRRNVAIALHHALSPSDYYAIADRLIAIAEDHQHDPAGGDPRLVGLVEDLARLGSYTDERTI